MSGNGQIPAAQLAMFGDTSGAVGGDALVFDDTTGLWVPGAVASGGTAADLGTKVRLAANQTLTTGVTATVAFSAEDWDDEGLWAAGTPTKLVIPAGWTNVRVELTAAVVFAANATGRRVARIEKNGSIIARQDQQALTVAGAVTSFNLVAETTVSAGDEITLVAFQDSGGDLDLVASTANPVNLTLTRNGAGAAVFHGCRARMSAGQSLANNTATAVAFTAADDYDTDAIHNPATNPSRFTVPFAGVWGFKAATVFTGVAAQTLRTLQLAVNGTTAGSYGFARVLNVPSVVHVMVTVDDILLAPGDYVELWATQVSGGSLNLNTAAMSAHYLGLAS